MLGKFKGAFALKKWLSKMFFWKLGVKPSKLHGDEKILYLANMIMDELKAQGYVLQPTANPLATVDIDYYTNYNNMERPNLRVNNICAGWSIDGFRTQ